MEFDVFICHASEDKDNLVRPLATALAFQGLKVWYDEFTLEWGDSLTEKIDYGLSNSVKGIVVLSPNFFIKNWPRKELRGLSTRDVNGEKVILPIWHNITASEIIKYSPTLADLVAIESTVGIPKIVRKVLYSLNSDMVKGTVGFLTDIKKKPARKFKVASEVKKVVKIHGTNGISRYYNLNNKIEGRQFLEIGIVELLQQNRGKKISVILADIDDLTIINKHHSIEVGNSVLKTVFDLINKESKTYTNYVGRCGDDTFFALFIGLGIVRAKNIANNIRSELMHFNWFKFSTDLNVTCSFGIARLGAFEDPRDSIIRASQGVTQAKKTGKNLILSGPIYLPKQETFEEVGYYKWS